MKTILGPSPDKMRFVLKSSGRLSQQVRTGRMYVSQQDKKRPWLLKFELEFSDGSRIEAEANFGELAKRHKQYVRNQAEEIDVSVVRRIR